MKRYFLFLSAFLLFFFSCKQTQTKEAMVKEIIEVERQFQEMTEQKGIADAFHFFADENAVIKSESGNYKRLREIVNSNSVGTRGGTSSETEMQIVFCELSVEMSDILIEISGNIHKGIYNRNST